jgi:hypothetical protein
MAKWLYEFIGFSGGMVDQPLIPTEIDLFFPFVGNGCHSFHSFSVPTVKLVVLYF